MNAHDEGDEFRLGIAEGVIARKWARVWETRFPHTPLQIITLGAVGAQEQVRSGEVDAVIFRIPPEPPADLRVIPLYEETPVVIVPIDHYACAAETIQLSELAGEVFQQPVDGVSFDLPGTPALAPPQNTYEATQIVAAGVGVSVVPMSLARLHHRKDLTYRPIEDLPVVPVAVGWDKENADPRIDDLIGILRGRTERSTRGAGQEPAPKRTAAQKAAARREYLQSQRPNPKAGTQKKGGRGRSAPRPRRGRK